MAMYTSAVSLVSFFLAMYTSAVSPRQFSVRVEERGWLLAGESVCVGD